MIIDLINSGADPAEVITVWALGFILGLCVRSLMI